MNNEKKYYENGFWIIGKEPEDLVPTDCPLCNLSMRDMKDITSYESYKVCNTCKVELIEPNKIKYNKGWRPGKEEMTNIRKYELARPSYLLKQ